MQGFGQPLQNGLAVLIPAATSLFAGIGLRQINELIIRGVLGGHNAYRSSPAVGQGLLQQSLAAGGTLRRIPAQCGRIRLRYDGRCAGLR